MNDDMTRGNGDGGQTRGRYFDNPATTFAGLDSFAASRLATAVADVALVLDADGVIRDMALADHELAGSVADRWVGKPWMETVTVESRSKVEALLSEAAAGRDTPRRHVNHPHGAQQDLPVMYSAVTLSEGGPVLALGQDLRPLSSLQQRLMDVQQSLERDYARLRHAETRYRLLFQTAAEAVLIVDSVSMRIVDANAACEELLGAGPEDLNGRPVIERFDAEGGQLFLAHAGAVMHSGQADPVIVGAAGDSTPYMVNVSLFRQDSSSLLLVRVTPAASAGGTLLQAARPSVRDVVAHVPDGVLVSDPDGVVMAANTAFLDLVELATENQAIGKPLFRWLSNGRTDFNVLMSNLRKHGAIRLFPATLRGELGAEVEVEINAVSVQEDDRTCLGFTIRTFSPRTQAAARAGSMVLPGSLGQITDRVGRVPLKDLVRESTDVVERLCIEAALELTGNNRSSAAEMLGLSRQSLYVKLRRFGLDEDNGNGNGA